MKKIDIKSFINSLNSLNPKEIHNWPLWANVFIGSILFIVLVAAGTGLYLMDEYDRLGTEQAKEEKLKQDFLTKKKQAINLDLYKKQLEEVTAASDILLKQLPNKSEMDKLLVDINQAAISKGLQIELFKPGNEKVYEFYADLPISIKVNGTYKTIGEFASDVSNLSRVVLFSDIALSKKDQLVSMEVTAKTFRYLDQDELDKQKAEKEKAKRDAKAKSKPAAPEAKVGH
jgi:type IV pilus assembly protein PilO